MQKSGEQKPLLWLHNCSWQCSKSCFKWAPLSACHPPNQPPSAPHHWPADPGAIHRPVPGFLSGAISEIHRLLLRHAVGLPARKTPVVPGLNPHRVFCGELDAYDHPLVNASIFALAPCAKFLLAVLFFVVRYPRRVARLLSAHTKPPHGRALACSHPSGKKAMLANGRD